MLNSDNNVQRMKRSLDILTVQTRLEDVVCRHPVRNICLERRFVLSVSKASIVIE